MQALAALCPGIASSTSLIHLDLSTKSITAAGCEPLADALSHNDSVRRLTLAANEIGADGIARLGPSLSSLHHLDLSGCGLTCSQSGSALANVLSATQHLRSLRLDDNALSSEAVEALCKGLPHAAALNELSLRACPLGADGVTIVAKNLPPSLTILDLSNTGAGPDGIAGLAAALSEGRAPQLSRLLICNCDCDDASLATLAQSLSGPARVSQNLDLDFGGNKVGPGAIAAMAGCSPLLKACLHDCKLGSEGAAALVESLRSEKFTSLLELDVSGNGLEEGDIVSILGALRGKPHPCPSLELLVVAANPGANEESVMTAVEELQSSRPGINVVRRSADTGEKVGGHGPQT